MMYWIRKLFSSPSIHLASAGEVAVTAVFSLIPFFITYFVLVGTEKNADIEFSEVVARGQFFLLAYGIFGSVFWLAFLRNDVPRHDARAFIGLIAVLLVIPVVGFMGVDPTFQKVQNPSVIWWSYLLYAALLVINYLLLFFCRIEPPEPQDTLSKGAQEMRKKFEESANGKK